MSWLFSQALVAEYWAGTCSGGAPSAPLSVMPTTHKFWRNDKTMDASKLSQFGLTCAVLTVADGAALLTSYLVASRARTSQQPAPVSASTAPDPASGSKWHESSVRFCLDSSTWRTHRCLWDEALPWSSVTLPNWGMTRAGYVYQHPTSERPISETDSGLWPTPTVHGNHNQPGMSKNAGWGLSSAAKLWPTPTASDSNKWSNQSLIDRKAKGQQVRLNTAVSPEGGKGGQLNPEWVEWLMGWPIGWTGLKPLAMARFHEWQLQHSPCSAQGEEEAA